MALGVLLIVLGFVFLFLVFPLHVLIGVIAIVLGILDLFMVGRAAPRRYWY